MGSKIQITHILLICASIHVMQLYNKNECYSLVSFPENCVNLISCESVHVMIIAIQFISFLNKVTVGKVDLEKTKAA